MLSNMGSTLNEGKMSSEKRTALLCVLVRRLLMCLLVRKERRCKHMPFSFVDGKGYDMQMRCCVEFMFMIVPHVSTHLNLRFLVILAYETLGDVQKRLNHVWWMSIFESHLLTKGYVFKTCEIV